MGRAPCCEKVGLKKGRWTAEEDQTLINYIRANGEGSWRSLPKNAGLLRCGKSCRLRWINYLRADLKRGNITPQEEDIIIRLHASLGNRWSLIASQLPGRTDNEIKNYWNSHLSRKIDTFRRPISIMMHMPSAAAATSISSSCSSTASDAVAQIKSTTVVMESKPPPTSTSKRRGGRGGRTSRLAMKKNKPTYAASNAVNQHKLINCIIHHDDTEDRVPIENSTTGSSTSSINLCPPPPAASEATTTVAAGNIGHEEEEVKTKLGGYVGGPSGHAAGNIDDCGVLDFNEFFMADVDDVVNEIMDPTEVLTLTGERQSEDDDVMGILVRRNEDSGKLLRGPNQVRTSHLDEEKQQPDQISATNLISSSNSNSNGLGLIESSREDAEAAATAAFDGKEWYNPCSNYSATATSNFDVQQEQIQHLDGGDGTILADDDLRWDWESIIQKHDGYLWNPHQKDIDDENMISWLCEQASEDQNHDHSNNKFRSEAIVQHEKQNDMLSWLLS